MKWGTLFSVGLLVVSNSHDPSSANYKNTVYFEKDIYIYIYMCVCIYI